MSVSGPTDDNVPEPDAAVPSGDDEPPGRDGTPAERDHLHPTDDAPARGESAGARPQNEPPLPPGEVHHALTRPCAYCGRPVPQPGEWGPSARYCLDNDGACARAAAERRRRDQ